MNDSFKHLGSAAIVVVFCILAAGTAPVSEEAKAENEAVINDYEAKMRAVAEKFSELDVTKLEPKKCDWAAIRKSTEVPAGNTIAVSTVHYSALAQYLDETLIDEVDDNPWAFMAWRGAADDVLKRHRNPMESSGNVAWAARIMLEEGRFFAVVYPTPGVEVRPARDDDDWEGFFDGWLVIIDRVENEAECQYPLSFESSDVVEWREIFGKDREDAILQDFRDNFFKAVGKYYPEDIDAK